MREIIDATIRHRHRRRPRAQAGPSALLLPPQGAERRRAAVHEAVSRRTWRSIRWGRVLLILVILSLLLFLAALAWVSLRDLAGVFLGDASELSLEAVVLTVGLLFMLFFFHVNKVCNDNSSQIS